MPPKKKSGKQKGQGAATGGKKAAGMNGMVAKMDQLLSRIPRGTFATVGGALGGPTGAMIGKGISTITGYGDYNVKQNTLLRGTTVGEMADQVPVFRNFGADTKVKHCEFVHDLVAPDAPGAFTNMTFQLDPTNSTTFPWLSSVARKYQRYKVKGMVIGYRSTSTDYNNSGVVAISVNYDPAEVPYESMEGLLNTKFAVSTKPSISMLAPVECDPARSPMDGYYIKHNTSFDVNDATIRQTVLGTVNIATSGLTLPPGSTLGQIYISYDIELLYPYMHKYQIPVPLTTLSGVSGVINYANQAGVDTSLATLGYGDLVGYGNMSGDQIGFRWLKTPTTGGSAWYDLVFPPGTYRLATLDASWKSSGSSVTGGASVGALSYGSSVTITQMGVDAMFGDAGSSYGYMFTVVSGPEADRTVTPNQVVNRTQSGSSTYIANAIAIVKIA